MGFRFRRSIRLAPGLRINLSKKGVSSLSIGKRGATLNLNPKSPKLTVGLPGSGLSYSQQLGERRSPEAAPPVEQSANFAAPSAPARSIGTGARRWIIALLLVMGLIVLAVLFSLRFAPH